MRITPPWLEEGWSKLASCEVLGPHVMGSEVPTLNQPEDLFEDLVSSIVYQQLSGKAAGAIWARFAALFPDQKVTPEHLALRTPEELRQVGLSRQKASYVLDLAVRAKEGRLPLDQLEQMDDATVHELLTQVKGIGPWTADMMLIFSLHRPDVFPSLDLGIMRGCQRVFGLPSMPKAPEMTAAAGRWSPFRTAASLALWRVADLPQPVESA